VSPLPHPLYFCDNQSVVSIAHNPIFHHRTKHMVIDVFFVREKILAQLLFILHIPALDQHANILTKSLSSNRLVVLHDKLVKNFCDDSSHGV